MKKKNFCLNKVNYTIVVGERNYLEFFVAYKSSSHVIRKRIYKGFSISDDLDELYPIALKTISQLSNKSIPELLHISKLHEYIHNHKYRYKPRTYSQFEGICNRFVQWCKDAKIIPHKISFDKAHQFIRESAETRKNGTIWNIQLVLKTVFNGLKKEKVISENVWESLPKIKKSPNSLMYFNSVQISMIKNYCIQHNPQLLNAISLVRSCGIRTDELRHLQVMDFLLEDNLIELRGEESKRRKTRKAFLSEQIKMNFSMLQNYPPHYFVFGKYGVPSEKMVSYNFLNDKHRLVLKELNIKGRYALYSWKHTGAVSMVRANINIKLIQQQFGHSSLDMTNEYLKNLGITDNDDLKNKLPDL